MFPEMRVRSFRGRYADRTFAGVGITDDWTAGVGRAVNIANCSLAVIGGGCGVCCGVSKGFAFSCGAILGCGIAPLISGVYACVSKSTEGRSLPCCDGNGASPVAGSSLAAIELAFDSNVFSFGGSTDCFDSSVSIKAEFFGTRGAGGRSTSVN